MPCACAVSPWLLRALAPGLGLRAAQAACGARALPSGPPRKRCRWRASRGPRRTRRQRTERAASGRARARRRSREATGGRSGRCAGRRRDSPARTARWPGIPPRPASRRCRRAAHRDTRRRRRATCDVPGRRAPASATRSTRAADGRSWSGRLGSTGRTSRRRACRPRNPPSCVPAGRRSMPRTCRVLAVTGRTRASGGSVPAGSPPSASRAGGWARR